MQSEMAANENQNHAFAPGNNPIESGQDDLAASAEVERELVAEYDIIDDLDDIDEKESVLTQAQIRLIEKKTPMLEVDHREMSKNDFRKAYLRENVTTKQLIERKIEKQRILKQHQA